MVIYGLRGITHGGAKVLTVMSPNGARQAQEWVDADSDLMVNAGEGRLTQYLEKRAGALDRLIQTNQIVVLDKPAWDAKKRTLGTRIWS